ncbi:CBF/NF-Y family transcription factor [Aspergillus rambellii]|uniref:CBF/NF-Y family transcription factor n=2 Tax=Aspergillus subgen. Nidulantes TaxID=2720870 RepID=A0A0F8XSI3_9EURO|nr:CBF/NF-Y family transcription factor [Aspergillus ochraceoroseus]KKK26492.1 CBF/NF-Y family transcription factor [Aspergillus rambellii]
MPTKDTKAASGPHSTYADQEITGQSALPISRIKKIIQLDEDIVQCSSNATFLVAMATELFIQYLTEQGHNVVKSERKPRKTIQYKDLATAVSRIDNLEFLADVIPKTTTYKQFKEKRAKETAKEAEVEKGQRTLNGAAPASAGDAVSETEKRIKAQAGEEKSLPSRSSRPPTVTMLVDEVINPQPGDDDDDDDDVEMKDQ